MAYDEIHRMYASLDITNYALWTRRHDDSYNQIMLMADQADQLEQSFESSSRSHRLHCTYCDEQGHISRDCPNGGYFNQICRNFSGGYCSDPCQREEITSASAAARTLLPPSAPMKPPLAGTVARNTPLRPEAFQRHLRLHPDRRFVQQLLQAITHRTDIGFQGPERPRFSKNAISAFSHATSLLVTIASEVSKGRCQGPSKSVPFPNFVCNPIGAVPKKNGDVRIILDLSQPTRDSVNSHIDKDDFSLSFPTVDQAVFILNRLGNGAFMAKFDIQSAFRLIPVRKLDHHLLGFKFDNFYYYDTVLSMGCRSSPFWFC
ncbi:hypothetical protein RvY_11649-1 [Ramazzottius varieornatus]|uniref:CCHC-type domain-containing protein n=1 Tax=Ramazzottius varieornatus TaxID=947166 RepID=A0A1D1VGW3_RAMVA|nr:hypothetical protein RvY_11649-1 [Ramazzottius varieornatus]